MPEPYFTLQWHITAKCDQHCQHCYMHDSPSYINEIKSELNYNDCIRIIDNFHDVFSTWGMPTRINFTGGDPLLREDIYDLIKYAHNKGITIGILGNPNHLDYDTALSLKNSGVSRYQLSIDGTEEIHDLLRGRKGLFKDTIRAIHILNGVGIPSVIMFTLSRQNKEDLQKVIRIVANEKVSVFDFARIVPIGLGRSLKDNMLNPQEYAQLLLEVLNTYRLLHNTQCYTQFGRKDHLWKLLYQDLGLLKPLPDDSETIFGGCGIGSSILTILADGTVYACRRLPITIGNVPEESIKDIFLNSVELNKMRQERNMMKCSKCDLLQFCRGCPAISYAIHGDYMASDPQCWKEV